MAISKNINNDRMVSDDNQGNTMKNNYTAIRYGNDHGSISFGHIHKPADVTSSVLLQAKNGEHLISMDEDGQRKNWTTIAAPGNIQIECGSQNEESQESLLLNAKNGNIHIVATNGKLILQGTDVEIIAVGEGGSKGNVKIVANENIFTDSKKLLMNAKVKYKIASPGVGEICANSVLKLYGSMIRGVTDACSKKDSKVGGKKFQQEQQSV